MERYSGCVDLKSTNHGRALGHAILCTIGKRRPVAIYCGVAQKASMSINRIFFMAQANMSVKGEKEQGASILIVLVTWKGAKDSLRTWAERFVLAMM